MRVCVYVPYLDTGYANALVTYQRTMGVVQPCRDRTADVPAQLQGGEETPARSARPARHRRVLGAGCYELNDKTFQAMRTLVMKCGEGCRCGVSPKPAEAARQGREDGTGES